MLKRGDIISNIENKSVESIVDSLKKYYPASNETTRLRDISRDILWYDNIRQVISRPNNEEKSYALIDDNNIGYVNLKTIKNEDISVIKREFINTKGIIIDIRNGVSDVFLHPLISFFYLKDSPVVKYTKLNPNNPGEFNFTETYYWPKIGNSTYHGSLVVLVNEDVQSTYEYYTMAFQAGNNTTLIGSPTAGANGNVSEIVLPGGLKTKFSAIGIYYPDGRETQRLGIIPDIEVKQTIQGIREGRDELLEKAIEVIRQQNLN